MIADISFVAFVDVVSNVTRTLNGTAGGRSTRSGPFDLLWRSLRSDRSTEWVFWCVVPHRGNWRPRLCICAVKTNSFISFGTLVWLFFSFFFICTNPTIRDTFSYFSESHLHKYKHMQIALLVVVHKMALLGLYWDNPMYYSFKLKLWLNMWISSFINKKFQLCVKKKKETSFNITFYQP